MFESVEIRRNKDDMYYIVGTFSKSNRLYLSEKAIWCRIVSTFTSREQAEALLLLWCSNESKHVYLIKEQYNWEREDKYYTCTRFSIEKIDYLSMDKKWSTKTNVWRCKNTAEMYKILVNMRGVSNPKGRISVDRITTLRELI